jgi:hypothetical protein
MTIWTFPSRRSSNTLEEKQKRYFPLPMKPIRYLGPILVTAAAVICWRAFVAAEPAFSFPRPDKHGDEAELGSESIYGESGSLTPGKGNPHEDTNPAADNSGRLLAPRKKSFRRMQKPRLWSFGARVGMWGNTGLSGQYIGDGENTWNIGLNILDVDNTIGIAFGIEMLWLFDEEWNRLRIPDMGRWKSSRGKLQYYLGGGIQAGNDGVWPRVPFGIQITNADQPFNFSAQLTLMAGQIAGRKAGFTPLLAPEIAIRYVLENQ